MTLRSLIQNAREKAIKHRINKMAKRIEEDKALKHLREREETMRHEYNRETIPIIAEDTKAKIRKGTGNLFASLSEGAKAFQKDLQKNQRPQQEKMRRRQRRTRLFENE